MTAKTFETIDPFIIDNDSNIIFIVHNYEDIHLTMFLYDLNIFNFKKDKADGNYAGLTAFSIYDPKELDILKLYLRLNKNQKFDKTVDKRKNLTKTKAYLSFKFFILNKNI